MPLRFNFEVISSLVDSVHQQEARLTLENAHSHEVQCQVWTSWSGIPKWSAADPKSLPELYRFAFMKLCFQHLKARQLMGLPVDAALVQEGKTRQRVRFAVSDAVIAEYVTAAVFSPYSFPCNVSLYIDDGQGHRKHSWFTFTDAQKAKYSPFMRDAALMLWRAELSLKKTCNIGENTSWEDLQSGLVGLRIRLEKAHSALKLSETVFEFASEDPLKSA